MVPPLLGPDWIQAALTTYMKPDRSKMMLGYGFNTNGFSLWVEVKGPELSRQLASDCSVILVPSDIQLLLRSKRVRLYKQVWEVFGPGALLELCV